MHSILYRVTFVGGPSDGLVIRATRSSFRPRKLLSLPVSPIFVQHDHTNVFEYVGESRSTYRMTSRHYREVGGVPVVRLRYDFLRVEYNGRIVAGYQAQDNRNDWLIWLRAGGRRAWSRVVYSLFALIDYRLNPSPPPQPRRDGVAGVEQLGPG